MWVSLFALFIAVSKCIDSVYSSNAPNATNNPTVAPPTNDLTMLIVMCSVAGIFVMCGVAFGIYILCSKICKQREYSPI